MKRILLVDDESDVCFVLEKVLIEHGYVADSYEHPLVALDKFKPHLYDLVILDIRMPDLNGFALYREIKKERMLRFVSLRQGNRLPTTECIQIYSLQFLPIVLFENQLKMKS